MIHKKPSSKPGYIQVTFEIPACIWAEKVYLVGDFNNWEPFATPFRRIPNGVWHIALDLPARQRFEFRYLIDGQWRTDFHADGCVLNSRQTLNSVVETVLPVEALGSLTGHGMIHESSLGSRQEGRTSKHVSAAIYAQETLIFNAHFNVHEE